MEQRKNLNRQLIEGNIIFVSNNQLCKLATTTHKKDRRAAGNTV